jgi:hypothetical protein
VAYRVRGRAASHRQRSLVRMDGAEVWRPLLDGGSSELDPVVVAATKRSNKSFDPDAQVRPCALRTLFVCAGQLRRYAV